MSKFYTHVITRTVHALSTNTTRRLHTFYARVGAAIPLTGTVIMTIYLCRKNCIFCKCPLECHDIPLNTSYNNLPEDRMGVEETPPRSSLTKVKEANVEGFEWVPAGLTSYQV